MRTEDLYLVDIITAADAVAEYIHESSWEDFLSRRMLRSAVVHELQIIGEAVARLSRQLRERYPDIPWSEIIGFRNVVVHEYQEFDLHVLKWIVEEGWKDWIRFGRALGLHISADQP